MNGKKAQLARRILGDILKGENAPPLGYKKFPWGQIINPRRVMYKQIKKEIKNGQICN